MDCDNDLIILCKLTGAAVNLSTTVMNMLTGNLPVQLNA
jgi:hypothetical protein